MMVPRDASIQCGTRLPHYCSSRNRPPTFAPLCGARFGGTKLLALPVVAAPSCSAFSRGGGRTLAIARTRRRRRRRGEGARVRRSPDRDEGGRPQETAPPKGQPRQGLSLPTFLSLGRSKPWAEPRREAPARYRVRCLQHRFDGLSASLTGPGDSSPLRFPVERVPQRRPRSPR
jgi:hypothetical protein